MDQTQNSDYAGQCENFIEGITGSGWQGATANQAWQNQQPDAVKGLNGVNPGDKVYFGADASNQEDGHVGMYLGNNQMLSATDNGIQVTDLTKWQQDTGQQILGYVKGNGVPDLVKQKLQEANIPMDNNGQPTQGQQPQNNGAEPMVQIRNNSTGQTMYVPQSQVGQYVGGGTGGGQPSGPAIGSGTPATANSSPSIAGGNIPSSTNTQSASQPGGINPQSSQEAQDQQSAQAMWKSAKNQQQQDNISQSWASSHGYDLFGTKPLSAQQTDLQNNMKEGNLNKQQIQQTLSTYAQAPHGNVFQGFLGNLPGSQGSTYETLRQNLGDWGKDLPTTADTQQQAQQKIMALDNKLRNTYGFSLDSNVLGQFGMSRDSNGNAAPGNSSLPVGNNSGNTPQNGQPTDTLGKVITGGVGDVGAILHSPIDLAQNIIQNTVKEHGNVNAAIGDTAIGVGKGIVNEYGNLFGAQTKNGQPILPPDKSVFQPGGVNVPTGLSTQAAVQHLENHPVNSIMDVLPALKAVEALKGASTVGEGAEGATAAKAAEIPGKEPAPAQIESFKDNYPGIPSRRGGSNDLNIDNTSKEILQHVDSGMNPDNLPKIPQMVTGDNGIITKMTRDAVGKINTPVPLADGENTAGTAAQNILDRTAGITQRDETKIGTDIRRVVNGTVTAGGPPGTANALDLFDAAKQLQKTGMDHLQNDTYINPNPVEAGIGKAYLAAYDHLMEQIEGSAKSSNAVSLVKTPDRIAQLQQISPRLAAQVQQAQSIGDLRKTASPFVKLDQMQKISEQSRSSTFNVLAKQLAGRRSGIFATGGSIAGKALGVGAGLIHPSLAYPAAEMLGRVGQEGGMLLDRAFMPQYKQAAETVIPKARAIGSTMGKFTKAGGNAAKNYAKMTKFTRFAPQAQQ